MGAAGEIYIPYGIASSQTNPLRDGTVLFLRFGKLLLGPEGLVGLWPMDVSSCSLAPSFFIFLFFHM